MAGDLIQLGRSDLTVPGPPSAADQQDAPMGLASAIDLPGAIWRRLWLIVLLAAVGAAAAHFYTQLVTPLYYCLSKVYVQRQGPVIMNSDNQGYMMGSHDYLSTQAELIQSTSIINDAVRRLSTSEMELFRDTQDEIGVVRKMLQVSTNRGGMLMVAMLSPQPQEGATTVNTLVQSYISFHEDRKRDTAAEVLQILRQEKAKQEELLQRRFDRMLKYQEMHPDLALAVGKDRDGNVTARVATDRLDRLRVAMTQAEIEAIEAQHDYDSLKALQEDPQKASTLWAQSLQLESNTVTQERRDLAFEIRRTRAELERLKYLASPDHVNYKRLVEQLETLEARDQELRDEAVTDFVESRRRQAEVAQATLKDLRESFAAERAQVLELGTQQARYIQLESDWRQTRDLVEALDSRIKTIDVEENTGALNISIVEVARPSLNPVWPNWPKMLSYGFVGGLVLGVFLALVWDYLTQKVRTPEEVNRILGVPVLGLIPSIPGKSDPKQRGRFVEFEPLAPTSETYRTIRTMLLLATQSQNTNTLLVTSAIPGEGKTTTTSNLAISFAEAGRKTLIIDADLRRPMLEQIFESTDGPGLTQVLNEEVSWRNTIQATTIPQLDMIPAGELPNNPSELLGRDFFKRLLNDLSQEYDLVLIDSPPIGPVADSRILSSVVGMTLMVVRLGKPTRQAVRGAGEVVSELGNLFGVIANAVKPQHRHRYSYYYDTYGYYRRREYGGGYRSRNQDELKLLATKGNGSETMGNGSEK